MRHQDHCRHFQETLPGEHQGGGHQQAAQQNGGGPAGKGSHRRRRPPPAQQAAIGIKTEDCGRGHGHGVHPQDRQAPRTERAGPAGTGR